jgi:hypothetical protein
MKIEDLLNSRRRELKSSMDDRVTFEMGIESGLMIEFVLTLKPMGISGVM